MEFHLSFSLITTSTLFVIVLAFLLHIVNIKRRANRKPPQADGALPIIGHLHRLGGPELAHKVLGDMADKHGPIFTVKLGSHQVLVVSNGEMCKECFTTNDKAFASRPKTEAFKLLGHDYAMFGVAPYGDYWRDMRKIITLEVLSPRRVELVGHIRASEVKASIKDLYEAWVSNKDSKNLNMVKVDMGEWFWNLILNIVIKIILGKRFSANDEEKVQFHQIIKIFFKLFGAFVVSDFIPYLKWLDIGGYRKTMKKMGGDLDNYFEKWLKEHKIARETAKQHEGSNDLMNVLLDIFQTASEDEFHDFDHDTIIKATCQQFLLAGVDTTSVTLTWALALLLNNPKALQIAQDELDEHVGRDRLVEESDMKNLVYLDAIIKETLRLYSAAPLSVDHQSVEDCIVGGYNIPKGTRLMVNLWKMHHDLNVWSDPFEFRPERFLTSHKNIDVRGSHFELLPFGSGRRMCPGVLFSLRALGLTLASLIQQFELKSPSNEPVDMTGSQGMTNYKATPLEVLLAPRLSVSMYHDI